MFAAQQIVDRIDPDPWPGRPERLPPERDRATVLGHCGPEATQVLQETPSAVGVLGRSPVECSGLREESRRALDLPERDRLLGIRRDLPSPSEVLGRRLGS